MRNSSKTLLLLAGLATAGAATAATSASVPFQVTANVVNSCRVTATSDISFGAYDPTDTTAKTAQGSVTVRCTKGAAYNVALDQGANPATGSTAAAPARRMKNGTEFLNYSISATAGGAEWGNSASNPGTTAASNAAVPYTTYATLPAGQDVSLGNFSDTVNVTVNF